MSSSIRIGAKYEPGLDGMRAIAAVAVIGFHCRFPWLSGGLLGVDLFFVLSGYLITGILFREVERAGAIDFAAFEMRRVRRLVPALGLMLTVVVTARPDLALHALAAVTYTMNFVRPFEAGDNALSHTWSLAAEAQFYLLWPFAVLALARFARRRAALILFGVWAVMTLARCAWVGAGAEPNLAYFLPVFRSTGLLLGAAAALYSPRLGPGWGWAGLALTGGLLAAGSLYTTANFTYLDPVIEAATVLVVLSPPRLLAWRPLVGVGKISYGLYLWHFPISFVFGPWPPGPKFAVVLTLSLGCATLSYFLVERPSLGVRRTPRAPAPIAALEI